MKAFTASVAARSADGARGGSAAAAPSASRAPSAGLRPHGCTGSSSHGPAKTPYGSGGGARGAARAGRTQNIRPRCGAGAGGGAGEAGGGGGGAGAAAATAVAAIGARACGRRRV